MNYIALHFTVLFCSVLFCSAFFCSILQVLLSAIASLGLSEDALLDEAGDGVGVGVKHVQFFAVDGSEV